MSTNSPLLNLQIMANGEYAGTWGTIANQDYYYLEQGVTGVASITLSTSTYTLSTAGASTTANAEAYQAVLNFTGTLTGICAVSIPIKPKAYIVRNGTSGGYAITMSAGGSTVTIPYGATSLVFCDSSGLTYAFSGADAFTATTLTSTGNTTIGGNLALTGNVSTALALANNLTTPAAYSVNFGSGQFVKDASGNIQTAAANTFDLGAGQFYKDASGNVGVNTSAPAVQFDVRGLVSAGGTPTKAPLSTVTISNPGAAYVVGDTLTLTAVTGTGTGATLRVDAVSGGTITAVHVVAAGSGYATGNSLSSSGGTGAGATFTVNTVANLTTSGDTNLTGTVAARGALNAIGALNAYSTLGVLGATTLTGAATMSGAATVNGVFTANQTAVFNGSTVTITNALTVGGSTLVTDTGKVGVGISPTSSLQVDGPIATRTPTLLGAATTYTVLSTDSTIICDSPPSTVTLTLPNPATCAGRCLTIGCYTARNINSSASNVVGPAGTTSTSIIPSTSFFATIQASGSVWRVISRT